MNSISAAPVTPTPPSTLSTRSALALIALGGAVGAIGLVLLAVLACVVAVCCGAAACALPSGRRRELLPSVTGPVALPGWHVLPALPSHSAV
mgnify:FL=1